MPSNEIKTDCVIGLMADSIKELPGVDVCSEFIAKSIRLGEITAKSLLEDFGVTIHDVVADVQAELTLNFGKSGRVEPGEDITLLELAKRMAEFANGRPK